MKAGEIYQHFKGHIVYIMNIGIDSENLEEIAIYHHLDDTNKIWVRPVKMFFEKIDSKKEDNITGQKTRFVKIKKEELLKKNK